MFYHLFKSPAIIKTGNHVLKSLDELLFAAHLHFPKKILVTQQVLWEKYKNEFPDDCKINVIFVKGGFIDEVDSLISQINNRDALVIAFGGGSVLDLVKYYFRIFLDLFLPLYLLNLISYILLVL